MSRAARRLSASWPPERRLQHGVWPAFVQRLLQSLRRLAERHGPDLRGHALGRMRHTRLALPIQAMGLPPESTTLQIPVGNSVSEPARAMASVNTS